MQKTVGIALYIICTAIHFALQVLFVVVLFKLTELGLDTINPSHHGNFLEAFLVCLFIWLPLFSLTDIGRSIYLAYYYATAYVYIPFQYVWDDLDYDEIF